MTHSSKLEQSVWQWISNFPWLKSLKRFEDFNSRLQPRDFSQAYQTAIYKIQNNKYTYYIMLYNIIYHCIIYCVCVCTLHMHMQIHAKMHYPQGIACRCLTIIQSSDLAVACCRCTSLWTLPLPAMPCHGATWCHHHRISPVTVP